MTDTSDRSRTKKRDEIAAQFKWKIDDLFATDDDWQKEFNSLGQRIGEFGKYRNRLGESAETLLGCLQARDQTNQSAERVYVYGNMKLHEDSANTFYQAMADKAETILIKLSSALSFIEPEILGIDEQKLKGFLAESQPLMVYAHYLENLLREKDHVLSPELEELLANAQEIGRAADTIYEMIISADMKFGNVKDESGQETQLTQGRYIALMESANRDIRKNTYETFYNRFIEQKNTLAATYSSSVKKDAFFAKARKYASSLECGLSGYNIPAGVYSSLIETVHEFLPALHRYVRLRKKRLAVDELRMYDLYTPIVANVDTNITYEEAKEKVLESLAPMGDEYVAKVKEGFDNGWVDVYENEGKRSGAYSWGANGSHPFVLLNFENKVDDMFTLAHEMGHAMHSYYSWGSQPYIYGDYTIFLAEVASTVNEALLMDYLMKNTTDPTMQAYLVNYFLEQFRGTVFRQTMFAEFEMLAHRMSEQGEPLTVESLCKLYKELNEKYYGPDMAMDELIPFEWARIPHFYTAFYVYQYATGYSAAIAFSKMIQEKGKDAVSDYKTFLQSGSSDYSINILKKAGVDMSDPQPIRAALGVFEELLGRMEALR